MTVGEIRKPHGLHGEVIAKFHISLDQFELDAERLVLADVSRGQKPRPVVADRIRPHKGNYIVKFDIADSLEEAEALRGYDILVDRESLKPKEDDIYFVSDIIGLKVIDDDGRSIGSVSDVWFFPSNDVYVVEGELGEVLIPAVEDYVLDVNVEEGKMTVKMDDGFISPSKKRAQSA